MGNKENLLVVGRHQSIMDKVIDTLKQQNYHAVGVSTDEEAVHLIASQEFDAVIFGGGVALDSTEYIKSAATKSNKKLKFIYAHPQTILEDIKQALQH